MKKPCVFQWYIIRPHLGILLFSVALLAANIIWITLDESPPLWDMAGHSHRSVEYAQLLSGGHPKTLWLFDSIYPPLSYFVTALLFVVFGSHTDIPQLSVQLWVVLYIISLYSLVRFVYKRTDIALGAIILSFGFPLLLHFTRIYDLDFQLTAIVTAALYCLIRSEQFQHRAWSVAFGIAVGCVLLTKWTGLIFLFGPAAYIFFSMLRQHARSAERWKNIALSIGCVLIVAAPWYFFHGKTILVSSFKTRNTFFSVPYEDLFSIRNALFYAERIVRSITWPLGVLSLVGILYAIKRRAQADIFFLVWIVVAYVLMTFVLFSKEIRYIFPIFPALATVSAAVLLHIPHGGKRVFSIVVVCFSVLWIGIETSTGVRFSLPETYKHIGVSHVFGYQEVTTEKVYYGLTYPTQYHTSVHALPRVLMDDAVSHFPVGAKIQIVVVPNSIYLTAAQVKYDLKLEEFSQNEQRYTFDFAKSSLVRGPEWRQYLETADYLITKTGEQGPAIFSPSLREIAQAEKDGDPIFTENFTLIQSWELRGIEEQPQELRLYRKK